MVTSIPFARISRYKEPADSLGYLLYQLSSLWCRQMNARLSEVDLTYIQFVLLLGLAWLTRDGVGITQKELGDFTKSMSALTSQVVGNLKIKGLILESTKPSDRRAKYLRLSAKGRAKVLEALPILDASEDAFLAEVSSLKSRVKQDLRRALQHELNRLFTDNAS